MAPPPDLLPAPTRLDSVAFCGDEVPLGWSVWIIAGQPTPVPPRPDRVDARRIHGPTWPPRRSDLLTVCSLAAPYPRLPAPTHPAYRYDPPAAADRPCPSQPTTTPVPLVAADSRPCPGQPTTHDPHPTRRRRSPPLSRPVPAGAPLAPLGPALVGPTAAPLIRRRLTTTIPTPGPP